MIGTSGKSRSVMLIVTILCIFELIFMAWICVWSHGKLSIIISMKSRSSATFSGINLKWFGGLEIQIMYYSRVIFSYITYHTQSKQFFGSAFLKPLKRLRDHKRTAFNRFHLTISSGSTHVRQSTLSAITMASSNNTDFLFCPFLPGRHNGWHTHLKYRPL